VERTSTWKICTGSSVSLLGRTSAALLLANLVSKLLVTTQILRKRRRKGQTGGLEIRAREG